MGKGLVPAVCPEHMVRLALDSVVLSSQPPFLRVRYRHPGFSGFCPPSPFTELPQKPVIESFPPKVWWFYPGDRSVSALSFRTNSSHSPPPKKKKKRIRNHSWLSAAFGSRCFPQLPFWRFGSCFHISAPAEKSGREGLRVWVGSGVDLRSCSWVQERAQW